MHFTCHRDDCPGFDVEVNTEMTAQDVANCVEAQDAHHEAHREADRPEVTHIRKQINPRRIRTGNQFYKDRCKLSAAENGSQTLCGAQATIEDLSWGDTRSAKSLAYVSCEACKTLRSAA